MPLIWTNTMLINSQSNTNRFDPAKHLETDDDIQEFLNGIAQTGDTAENNEQ